MSDRVKLPAKGRKGSDFYWDWIGFNCGRCALWRADDARRSCPLELSLKIAHQGDGTVKEEVANRIGYKPHSVVEMWGCPERKPI